MLTADRIEEARDAAYYDAHYREQTLKPYSQHAMWPVWQQVVEELDGLQNLRVIEIGCGSGGLAHYLHDRGFRNYLGIDFSRQAIFLAKGRTAQQFIVCDLTTPGPDGIHGLWGTLPYDVVVAIEVLEHLVDDLAVLRAIRPGTHVIFSVPNLNCAGHVRWFGSPRQVADRYRELLTMLKTSIFTYGTAKWFVCHGVRNG